MQDEFIRLQAALRKTIVFITHDFDEAIRLADRIAIMKDGAVVQTGTPEELVTSPADDYVAEFTKAVTRAKVVRVSSIMEPLPNPVPAGGFGGDVPATARVAEAAPVFGKASAVRVTGPDGEPVGILPREAVVALMMQG
jgi:glycine betaine/proline transport system ATP-binding protein